MSRTVRRPELTRCIEKMEVFLIIERDQSLWNQWLVIKPVSHYSTLMHSDVSSLSQYIYVLSLWGVFLKNCVFQKMKFLITVITIRVIIIVLYFTQAARLILLLYWWYIFTKHINIFQKYHHILHLSRGMIGYSETSWKYQHI